MVQIEKLIEELKKFPMDAFAYAYEGEIIGIVVVDADDDELGHIPASESSGPKQGIAILT